MSFNSDIIKQAQGIKFTREISKQFGIILENCLPFEENLEIILNKVNKTIGLLCKLHNILPRAALLTIYKDFVRPHLDYDNAQ